MSTALTNKEDDLKRDVVAKSVADAFASSDEEDEEKKQEQREKAYRDETLFDNIRDLMPPGKEGKRVLFLSISMQIALVVMLFFGHHHKSDEFTCCNMWAVMVAALFTLMQYAYYGDWVSILGDDPNWHRANLFVPMNLYVFVFIEWCAGTLSMLSHAVDLALFDSGLSDLNAFEQVSFVLSTILFFLLIWLFMIIAYAHRNNIGRFYYNQDESEDQLVEVISFPVPVMGSFNVRNILAISARWLRVDTSRKALETLPRLIVFTVLLQLPFYGLLVGTYANGNESNIPVGFLTLGVIMLIVQASWAATAFSSRTMRTRKWNRTNLFFPYIAMFTMIAAYVFTISSVFFKSKEGSEIWEDILTNLDNKERLYLITCFFLAFAILLVHISLTMFHRKGWCDGARDLEMMIKALEVEEEIARREEEQRKKRDAGGSRRTRVKFRDQRPRKDVVSEVSISISQGQQASTSGVRAAPSAKKSSGSSSKRGSRPSQGSQRRSRR